MIIQGTNVVVKSNPNLFIGDGEIDKMSLNHSAIISLNDVSVAMSIKQIRRLARKVKTLIHYPSDISTVLASGRSICFGKDFFIRTGTKLHRQIVGIPMGT